MRILSCSCLLVYGWYIFWIIGLIFYLTWAPSYLIIIIILILWNMRVIIIIIAITFLRLSETIILKIFLIVVFFGIIILFFFVIYVSLFIVAYMLSWRILFISILLSRGILPMYTLSRRIFSLYILSWIFSIYILSWRILSMYILSWRISMYILSRRKLSMLMLNRYIFLRSTLLIICANRIWYSLNYTNNLDRLLISLNRLLKIFFMLRQSLNNMRWNHLIF